MVAFEADAWEAGINIERSSMGQMRQWLDQIVVDGLPKHTVYVTLLSLFHDYANDVPVSFLRTAISLH